MVSYTSYRLVMLTSLSNQMKILDDICISKGIARCSWLASLSHLNPKKSQNFI